MTTTEPSAATSISSALDSVGRAMHWLDLEMAWIEGLRQCKHPTDRDRIMAAAGRRLRVFDEVLDDRLRLTWLSDVASEVRSRGDQPLGDKLGALAIAELREASARMRLDLEALRKSAAAGESVREWAWNNVAAANRIRDLGRTAKNLNGTGLLALVDSQDADLAIRLADAMASGARLVAAVPEPLRIDRNDLIAWAKRPEAASRLPVLLRRLISETTDVERIDFPSGSAVATRGWDGIVNSIGGNQYVPAGESCWEVSAQQSGSDRKARDDYRKRTERLSREQRRGLSYVAVICAPWTKKRDFAPEMRARRDFRDVHALNVDDLEAWLECAPQTTVWLRELMGEPVAGIRSLSSWWTQWLESTNPALDAGVVLAGRDNQAAKLRDRCGLTRGGVITVGGQVHRDEIIAFVSAALVSTKGSDSSRADVLYVDDPNSAERLLTTAAASASSPLRRPLTVLVPSADFAQCVPPGSRCHVIVPVPGAATAEILLVPVDNEPAARVFEEIGADGNTAHRWGSLARMSLMTLRRELATSPELHRPQWASGHVGHALRRGLLLGGWDDNRAGDRQVVEELLGHSYDDATEALRGLDPGDAPMLQTGDVWHTVSPADAWVLLNGHITGDEVDAFGKIAHRVLTEPHPSYGMTASEAFRAACEGMVGRYSPAIKRGIATTVALLGSRPPELPGAATPATSAAAGIVWSILRSANNDPTPRTWHAAADALPLLAEAEPDAVLQSLRSCLSDAHPFAREMFADGRSDEVSVPGPSPHLRVLDALETAAWSPDHMPASVDLLARLAGVDPGGPWSKRLAGSLASIMCPWLPYTSADADARLRTIRSLRRNHPDVAWRLMLSMLPDGHDFQVPGGRPRYRDWKQSEHAVTLREHTQVVASITEMLLEDMGENPDRWVDMIGEIDSLPEETRRRVLAGLNHLADAQPDEEFKSTVWPKLHYLVTHHRRFNDAVWALPEAEIAHCEVLLDLLRPADHAVGYGWLFSADPMVVDGVSAAEGQDTFQAALAPRQSEAVSTVLASGGLEAVWDFAAQVEQPWRVGRSLADGDPALDLAVLAAMDGAPEAVTQVALGYFSRRFSALGWEGLRRLIDAHNRSPQVVADLYRAPAPIEPPWRRVDALGSEVAEQYWSRVGYPELGIPEDLCDLLVASRRLREVGRLGLARLLLSARRVEHGSELEYAEEAAVFLEQWLDDPSESDRSTSANWQLQQLAEVLDEHSQSLGRTRTAMIEWRLCPELSFATGFEARSLYRAMCADSDLFVSMVELAFKPADTMSDGGPSMTEPQRQAALSAYQALTHWPRERFTPGPDGQGSDTEALDAWVDSARERLAKSDRTEQGDRMIGQALASSPAGADGQWPSMAVRGLIERLSSDDLDRGMRTAIFNQRGAAFSSPSDGGTQERELADQYRKQARLFSEWPRTAAIFRSLASSYEREAQVMDREAESFRRGLPL